MPKKLLSIILPVYNEEKNIPLVYGELLKTLGGIREQVDYEILFINDGSLDASLEKLKAIRQSDPHVRIIDLSRNFGHQAALTCGLNEAKGDYVVTMDADLQDPPELIPEMLKRAEAGNDIVYARRKKRDEGLVKKSFSRFYYFLLRRISSINIPSHVGDYRLISKRVLAHLNQCGEKARYIRGLVAWLGFPHDFVDFDRPHRKNGITGYSWKKMFKLGFDGFTGFSTFPLRIAAFIGTFVIGTSIAMFLYVSYDSLVNKVEYPLYKWLVIIVYGFMGIQFILMWLLGEYIGRIYEEQKGRPMYIVNNRFGQDHP